MESFFGGGVDYGLWGRDGGLELWSTRKGKNEFPTNMLEKGLKVLIFAGTHVLY